MYKNPPNSLLEIILMTSLERQKPHERDGSRGFFEGCRPVLKKVGRHLASFPRPKMNQQLRTQTPPNTQNHHVPIENRGNQGLVRHSSLPDARSPTARLPATHLVWGDLIQFLILYSSLSRKHPGTDFINYQPSQSSSTSHAHRRGHFMFIVSITRLQSINKGVSQD